MSPQTYRCRRCSADLGLMPNVYCRRCVEELLEEAARNSSPKGEEVSR